MIQVKYFIFVFGIFQVNAENLRVTSILGEPYLKLKEIGIGKNGNDKFEGYSKDLAEMLAQKLNSTYTITLVKDNKYGVFMNTTWHGMVGEIIQKEADIAIAPLTITPERVKVIDMSTPFQETKLSILAKKPTFLPASWMSSSCEVFKPMTSGLWGVVLLATILTVIIFKVIERKVNNAKQGDLQSENSFSCSPRSLAGTSTKLVFLIFIILFIAAYTANFGAFRIQSAGVDHFYGAIPYPITSVDELVKQTEIKYGTIYGGSTNNFFKNSTNPLYKKMYNFMETEETYTKNLHEGVTRVLEGKGKYVFIMESPQSKYILTQMCETMTIGKSFGPMKGFGIGTYKNSELSDKVNVAILELQASGALDELEMKWWNVKGGCIGTPYTPEAVKEVHIPSPLSIQNMAGIFYILIIGLVVSGLIALFEIRNFKKN